MKNNERWPPLKEEWGTLTLRLKATTVERQGTVHNPRNLDANLKNPLIRQTKLKRQRDVAVAVAVSDPTLTLRRLRVGKAWPARVLLVYSHLDKGVRKERKNDYVVWRPQCNPKSHPLQTPATILI